MRTPSLKGQYRKVEYTDDGCTRYQCLWCLRTIEIRDDPQYGWSFCPRCGKSWFTRLQCRDHHVPRWYYDRWGNPDDDPEAPYLWDMYPPRKQPTSQWVIECRTKWFDDPWGDWKYEFTSNKEPYKPDWQYAKQMLEYHRNRHDSDDNSGIKFEYRARLVKIT